MGYMEPKTLRKLLSLPSLKQGSSIQINWVWKLSSARQITENHRFEKKAVLNRIVKVCSKINGGQHIMTCLLTGGREWSRLKKIMCKSDYLLFREFSVMLSGQHYYSICYYSIYNRKNRKSKLLCSFGYQIIADWSRNIWTMTPLLPFCF